jgi:phosphoserine phosphatase RsbU/P
VHDEQYSSPETTSAQLTRLALIAAGGVLAVAASSARKRREARLADVLRVAEVAQRAVLPDVPDRIGMIRLTAHYESAAREASLGGDLYAALPTSYGVRLLIGDVRGKGLEAVRLASVILGAFRERAHERADLRTLARDLDRAVQRVAEPEDFVTAALAQLDDDCCLSVVNAGHPPPLLVRDGVTVPLLPSEPRPPLGLDGAPLLLTLQLRPKDRLLLYTDGMTEARRPGDGAFFPVEQVLARRWGPGRCRTGSPLSGPRCWSGPRGAWPTTWRCWPSRSAPTPPPAGVLSPRRRRVRSPPAPASRGRGGAVPAPARSAAGPGHAPRRGAALGPPAAC